MSQPHRSLASELLEVVSTGLPFCVFKAVVGLLLLREDLPIAGWSLLALALVDVGMNLLNLGGLLAVRRRVVSTCTFAALTARLPLGASDEARSDLGTALDVMVAFGLVAGMIALGRIGTLPPLHLAAWNDAVVLNVLGAGLGRLGHSVRRVR